LEIKNQEMKTKFGWKYYFSPTPKRLRVLGDSLAAAGTFGGTIVVLNGHPVAGTIVMIVAIVGKFISNFFSETPEDNG
jgi:hypothetical protein